MIVNTLIFLCVLDLYTRKCGVYTQNIFISAACSEKEKLIDSVSDEIFYSESLENSELEDQIFHIKKEDCKKQIENIDQKDSIYKDQLKKLEKAAHGSKDIIKLQNIRCKKSKYHTKQASDKKSPTCASLEDQDSTHDDETKTNEDETNFSMSLFLLNPPPHFGYNK